MPDDGNTYFTSDAPGIYLGPFGSGSWTYSYSMSFTMWQIYKAPGSESRWVALGFVPWNVSMLATYDFTTGALRFPAGENGQSVGTASDVVPGPSPVEPYYTGVIYNS